MTLQVNKAPVLLVHGPFGSGTLHETSYSLHLYIYSCNPLMMLILLHTWIATRVVLIGETYRQSCTQRAMLTMTNAGKTTLVVALILFLRGEAGAGGPTGRRAPRPRVLVAAHTNAAVDNILLGLAATGFDGAACKLQPTPRLFPVPKKFLLQVSSCQIICNQAIRFYLPRSVDC